MLSKVLLALFLTLSLASAATAAAQEVKPDPISDVTRYKIIFYKFAPGGKDIARQIVWDHLLPAMRKAGVAEPIVLHPEDGEWDMVSLYPLPGGYTDLHYNTSPTDALWQTIAVQGEQGKKFKELTSQLEKLIVRETSFISHCHNCTKP